MATLIAVKPLAHPALDDITVEGILHALSDMTRVQIFAQIADSNGSASCVAFTHTAGRDIPKSTLSQHFKVLREAGLVRSERIGVEMQNSSRCKEIESRFPGLIPSIVNALKTQSGQRATKRKPR